MCKGLVPKAPMFSSGALGKALGDEGSDSGIDEFLAAAIMARWGKTVGGRALLQEAAH